MSTKVPPSIHTTITPERKGHQSQPDQRGLQESEDVEVPPFDTATLDLVLNLLDYRADSPEKLEAEKEVRQLFQYWKVTAWDDLILFSGTDVLEALGDSYTGILQNLKTKKLLANIVQYARYGELTDQVTKREIVTTASKDLTPLMVNQLLGNKSNSAKSNHIVEKKVVPALKAFSGYVEDWYPWIDDSMNTLGRAALSEYLTDPNKVIRNPEVATSVFYALKAALDGGVAKHIAKEQATKGNYYPNDLYNLMLKHFDTPLNKANVVLHELQKLLKLVLTAETLPSQFISDYKEILGRLAAKGATIANDKDMLRALMLVAIQDDNYDSVRDKIVEQPNLDADGMMDLIRERDGTLNLLEENRGPTGDGMDIRSRRSSTQPAQGHKKEGYFIPFFPDSWRHTIGSKMFKVLVQWRMDATRNKMSQTALNKKYALSVSNYENTKDRNNKRKARRSKSTASDQDDEMDTDMEEMDSKSATSDSNSSSNRKTKRIKFLHGTRRTITERKI